MRRSAGEGCRRNREEQDCAQGVGGDEHGAPTNTIDPSAGEEANQKDGQAPRNDDERHFERPGVEDEQRNEGHGRPSHDGSELGHGLAGPQLHEIGVPPQRRRHLSHGGEGYRP